MKIKRALPFSFTYYVGYARYTGTGYHVPGTRKTLCVGLAEWNNSWGVWHIASGRSIIFHCPTRAYALRLAGLIVPYLNLFKLEQGTWDDCKEALPEWLDEYLKHVWKTEPKIDQLPKVEQWRKSNGFGGGAKIKVRRYRGKKSAPRT